MLMFFIVASGFKLYYQKMSEYEVAMESDEATAKMLRNSEIQNTSQLSRRNQYEMKYSNIDYSVAMSKSIELKKTRKHQLWSNLIVLIETRSKRTESISK